MALFNCAEPPVKRRLICGVTLQRHVALGTFSPTLLTCLGFDMQVGAVAVTSTTPRQFKDLTGQPMAFLRTFRNATPLERALLKNGGMTIEDLHRQMLDCRQRPTAADVDEFIVRAGAGAVLDGLDRYTRPKRTNGHAAANDNTGGNGSLPMPAQLSL